MEIKMTETWIPLWLFKDMVIRIEDRLRSFEKKEGAKFEQLDILISDLFDETIKFYLRGYDEKKKDYAYVQQAVTKRMINEVIYFPKPELKTYEDMMGEIRDILSYEGEK
jgi:hypothetical protein